MKDRLKSGAGDGEGGAGAAAVMVVRSRRLESRSTVDDPRWSEAVPYALTLDAEQEAAGASVQEGAQFRVRHDGEAAYLRVDLLDRDVWTDATDDTEWVFVAGDTAEWFIGTPPAADGRHGHYYELHVAPNGQTRAYQMRKPRDTERIEIPGFRAEVRVDGTLNGDGEEDRGWSAMLTLPWSALAALEDAEGRPVEPRVTPLTMLVGRYNYGRYFTGGEHPRGGPELSHWPTQPKADYHLRETHAALVWD